MAGIGALSAAPFYLLNQQQQAHSSHTILFSTNNILIVATMLMRSTASSALATAAALSSLLVLIPGSHAAATISSDNDNNNLRGRPVGATLIDQEATPSSSFGRVLQNILNTSEEQYNEDLDAHYPLFLTNNELTKDNYHVDDVLFSFTLTAPKSNIMRQPPGRKLAEAALADDAHAEDAAHEEGEGDAHDMVVHVTYENIYAILVFLLTATAFGIITSKLGMVSAIFYTIFINVSDVFFSL